MKNAPIEHASLSWNEQGTPVSRTFNDVYFSSQNGLEETRYVFLTGNQLPGRFLNHPRELFVVAETGFGTALNFLTLWQAFDHYRQQTPGCRVKRLHFISCEKFPLTISDMQQAHAAWPQLAPWSRELLSKWPEALPGCHRLLLAGGLVTLDLWYGDINDTIDTFDDTLQQQVDAWFLDGFAPAKNPTMWTPELFDCMARLGRTGTTLATFTAAGFVRRGLQKAGFALHKRKGFGRKREMLTGELIATREAKQRAPWYARPAACEGDIAIIGGGLASGLLAQALLRRGRQVTLYSAAQTPAEGASGNRQAALYPLLNPHDPALSRFFPTAFTFARRYYDAVALPYEHQWCGVTQLGWDKKSQQKIEKMLAMRLPATLAVAVNREQAEQLCGVKTGCGGIHYRSGGWLSPAELTTSLLKDAQVKGMALHWQHKLSGLKKNAAGWQLLFADGRSAQHQNVALASGASLNQLAQSEMLPVYAVAGQVSYIPTHPQLSRLQQVLCYDGYLTPVSPQYQTHCMGASYHRGSSDTRYRAEDQQNNALRLQRCLPEAAWSKSVDVTAEQARCGVRCATRDHLPMIGALPDYDATLAQYAALSESQQQAATAPCHQGVFVLGALGSRGLCSGPLAAEVLAAQLCAEPIPLDCDTLAATSPNRYWLRKLLKGRPPRCEKKSGAERQ